MLSLSKMRAVVFGLGGFLCLALPSPLWAESPSTAKKVEIFVGGKKYDSIDKYRSHQIDKLKKAFPAVPSSAPEPNTKPMKEFLSAFSHRMFSFLLVDENKMRQTLESILLNKTVSVDGLTAPEQPSKGKSSSKGQENQ